MHLDDDRDGTVELKESTDVGSAYVLSVYLKWHLHAHIMV